MASFYGEEQHTLDQKGRVIIPAPMRNGDGKKPIDTFYVVRGLDRCVALYPADEFKRVEEKLRGLGVWNKRSRLFSRMYLRNAEKLSCDAQGRITLSGPLIQWAELAKDVLVYGQGDHIEIWNPGRLDAQLAASADSLEELGAEVFKDERS